MMGKKVYFVEDTENGRKSFGYSSDAHAAMIDYGYAVLPFHIDGNATVEIREGALVYVVIPYRGTSEEATVRHIAFVRNLKVEAKG